MKSEKEYEQEIFLLNKQIDSLKSQLSNQQYGINWLNIPEAFEQNSIDKIPILEEVPSLNIITDDKDITHLLIEGDNYHSLSCLRYTHNHKVDVIYIDPPYNTGNKDFIYKDKRFLDELPNGAEIKKNNPARHSTWLSFISKRLYLAKDLLSDRGVIYISIDDNEQANLKLLCDQVFEKENYISTLIWKSKSGGANDSRYFATDTEYILVYAKKETVLNLNGDDEATVTTSYNREDENGRYALDRLDKQSIRYSDSLNYTIVGPDGKEYLPEHKDPANPNATWRWGKDTVKERYNELVFENGHVYTKNYEKDSVLPRNLLIEERFGRTRSGKTELFSIIGANDFPNPKPSKLIQYLIKLFPQKDCVILDFFAGSGTTLNAVLELNKIDGGSRKCIICTNNESNICTDITYPRVKNIIKGYVSKGNKTVELYHNEITITKLRNASSIIEEANAIKNANNDKYSSISISVNEGALIVEGKYPKNTSIPGIGGNLKYYRTNFVGKNPPRMATDSDKVELATKAGCLLSITEDTLFEIESNSYYQIFTNNRGKITAVYFQEDLSEFEKFRNRILSIKEIVSLYIFSWSDGSEFKSEFELSNNITIKAIPQPILEIYKTVNY